MRTQIPSLAVVCHSAGAVLVFCQRVLIQLRMCKKMPGKDTRYSGSIFTPGFPPPPPILIGFSRMAFSCAVSCSVSCHAIRRIALTIVYALPPSNIRNWLGHPSWHDVRSENWFCCFGQVRRSRDYAWSWGFSCQVDFGAWRISVFCPNIFNYCLSFHIVDRNR